MFKATRDNLILQILSSAYNTYTEKELESFTNDELEQILKHLKLKEQEDKDFLAGINI